MNSSKIIEKLSSPALVFAIVGTLKLVLQSFGIVIPDVTVNNFANGLCAVATIIGIFMNHDKKPVQQPPTEAPEQSSQPTPPSAP